MSLVWERAIVSTIDRCSACFGSTSERVNCAAAWLGCELSGFVGVSSLFRFTGLPVCVSGCALAPPYNPTGKMWYNFPDDYSFLGKPEFRDRPDLSNSRELLTDFLKSLIDETKIPFSRTILGGFSQGVQ